MKSNTNIKDTETVLNNLILRLFEKGLLKAKDVEEIYKTGDQNAKNNVN